MGGTFDPVHRGHLSIARSFLESGRLTELWVLLTPHPPHKERQALSGYEDRLEMLKAAFSGMERVRISDLETRLPRPSWTWRTLAHLRDEHPERPFLLCIGEDSYRHFTHWKKWRRIVRHHAILVAERPDAPAREVPEELKTRVHFVPHKPVEVSSTDIRRTLAEGGDVSPWLPEPVLAIIRSRKLYQTDDHVQP